VNLLKSVIIGVFLGILLLCTPAFCQDLYQYEANVEIFDDLTSHSQIKLVFSDSAFDDISFTIENSPQNLNITSPASCSKTEKSWGVSIYCDLAFQKGQDFNIIVDYDSNGLVKNRDKYFVFTDAYKAPVQTKNLLVLVKVPEGMGLIKPEVDQPYNPSTATVGTDGRRPILAWQKSNVSAGDGLAVTVSFEKIALITNYSRYIGMQIGVFLIILSIALALYKFYFKKKGQMKVVLPVLKADEKIVFEKLLSQKGVTNQKVLVKESNYSKAKVSKVLKSLQERGLIRLERIGRTNRVYLVKDFKNKEQNTPGNN
jgi:uncharacterized membrane protein